MQKLFRQAFEAELLTPSEQKEESPVKQPEKKRQLEDHDEIEWTQHDGIVLSEHGKVQLCSGKWLSDKHVIFAQSLLKKQFPQVNGLKSTLLLHKTQDKIKEGVQIIHSQGNHWIVASILGCSGSVVKIFDSLYKAMDKDTQSTIMNTFERFSMPRFKIMNDCKQQGVNDCGLFTIAVATSLAFGKEPVQFQQSVMRDHLLNCFESGHVTFSNSCTMFIVKICVISRQIYTFIQ